MRVNQRKIHELLEQYIPSIKDYTTFYQQLMLKSPSGYWHKFASIDFWLLTCPLSWRELAWCFYKCNIPTAVIEIKRKFIHGENQGLCK